MSAKKTVKRKVSATSKPTKPIKAKAARKPREIKLTEAEEKILGIVKEAKSEGITAVDVAKKLFGPKKFGEVARPNQAVFFKIIRLNEKLAKLGERSRISKKNPGAARGKQITLFLDKAA